ncbi:MAG: signal peptidase I [Candidatus Bathyarchaeota archaeon]|jgi:signal peptidase|nr:signal peptidase I [Candidatus Bathyarchaeota archaeon A05DMB-5]MDH7558408.1 signal peptidase I [Candidatus Bathyarchaeota archaeon]
MQTRHKKKSYLKDALFLTAVILSVILIYVGLRLSLATDTPLVAIDSGSMTPALEVGDLLIIKGVKPEEINIGDIIVFDPPTQGMGRTVHRVITIQPLPNGTLTFKTKGDANEIEDTYTVYPQNIHGRVLYRIPYIGYMVINPAIPITIITVIIIAMIIWPEKKKRKFRHKPKTHIKG